MLKCKSIEIQGELLAPPVLRLSKLGSEIYNCRLTVLAASDFEFKEKVVEVEAWNKTARYCFENFSKGDKLHCLGFLRDDCTFVIEGVLNSQ